MARRLIAALVAVLFGCEADDPSRALPAFASALPGHTTVVAWGGAEDLDVLLPAALLAGLPTARVGLTAAPDAPPGVRAWLADAQGVGWPSLAQNQHFVRASAEFEPGGAHLFVDLQQGIDAARAALTSVGAGDAQLAGLRSFAEQRVWRVLRLDALQWLVVRAMAGPERTFEAVVASGDAERGLFACFAEAARPAPTAEAPAAAHLLVRGTFAPMVVAAGIRELLADEGDGPLAALQQLMRGSGVQAAIDALDQLDGAVVVAVAQRWGWAACGVLDANAVEAALDAFAVARGGHWIAFGSVRIELDEAVVRVSFGDVPAERRRLAPTSATLDVESTLLPFQLTAVRTGARLRLRGRVP